MIYSAKPLLKNALDPDGAGHTLALPPDDPFIVSCPGSGKTWPRFLPENRLHPQEPATLASIERRVCDAELRLSRYRRCIPSPRTIKNHSYFDPRYPRANYVVRDPRDMVLSEYDLSRKYRNIEDS